MKALAIIYLCLALQARADPPARIAIDFKSPKVDNEFSRLNPDYKERAASFYEREYLPKAADYLFEVCSIKGSLHPYVMEILRALLYEWGDAYMRGNGGMTPEIRAELVKRMDERLLALLDESQKERYPAWRNTRTGKNTLEFLLDTGSVEASKANPPDGTDQAPPTDSKKFKPIEGPEDR